MQAGEVPTQPCVERAGDLDGVRMDRDGRDEAPQRLAGEIQIGVLVEQSDVLEILIDHGGRQLRRLGDHGLQDVDLRFQIRDLPAHALKDGGRQHAGGHVLHNGVDLGLQPGDLALGGRDAAPGFGALAFHVCGERLHKLLADFRPKE